VGLGCQGVGTVSGVMFDEEDEPVNSDLATKQDFEHAKTKIERRIDEVETKLERRIDEVETKIERRIDEVETKLERRIDRVEANLDIVARQVGGLTERVDALRGEMNRDIAQHMNAGFEMMRQLFAVQDDRAKSIEDKYDALRRDFTAHTRDFVLHCKP
jgi:chaperonin cofactor prefoldin